MVPSDGRLAPLCPANEGETQGALAPRVSPGAGAAARSGRGPQGPGGQTRLPVWTVQWGGQPRASGTLHSGPRPHAARPGWRGQASEVFLRGGEDGRRRAAGARCRRTKARKALSQAAASPCPSSCPGLPVATVPVYLASPFSDGQRMESRRLLGLAGMRLRGARGFSAAATASVPSG